jgi:hypothetical protein
MPVANLYLLFLEVTQKFSGGVLNVMAAVWCFSIGYLLWKRAGNYVPVRIR